MTIKQISADDVNAIAAAIRALPAGKSAGALRYIDLILESKQTLEFAPNVGRDLIRLFEDHRDLQSFEVDIKWEFEDSESGDGYFKCYSYENLRAKSIGKNKKEVDNDPLGDTILAMISDDPEQNNYPALLLSPDMVCAAVGETLSSSREIYDRLNLAGELTPLRMYIESAPGKHKELTDLLIEEFAVDEPIKTNDRPRG